MSGSDCGRVLSYLDGLESFRIDSSTLFLSLSISLSLSLTPVDGSDCGRVLSYLDGLESFRTDSSRLLSLSLFLSLLIWWK